MVFYKGNLEAKVETVDRPMEGLQIEPEPLTCKELFDPKYQLAYFGDDLMENDSKPDCAMWIPR